MTEIYTLLFLFGILISGVALTLLYGLYSRGQMRAIEEERLYSTSTVMTLEEVELSQPFGDRVLRPVVSSLLSLLGRLTPQRNIEQTQHKLEIAGHPNDWTVADFMGLRLLSGALSTGMAFTLTLLSDIPFVARVVLIVAIGLLGFYLPVLWLGWRIRARQSEILRALPDGLDMLNICVGAGLGFDAALSRVGERWQTALADEFNRVVLEIRLGKSRRQALQDLANRTEVMEIENFVATIIQADQLGVSIAKVLRAQAEQMRIVRRQRAEELARQATIKLLFPLVLLIFPAMLAVLLGPAVPQILETLGRLGQ